MMREGREREGSSESSPLPSLGRDKREITGKGTGWFAFLNYEWSLDGELVR